MTRPAEATGAATAGLWTDAARDVLAERTRQVEAEGWSVERDFAHNAGEMAEAAAYYALRSLGEDVDLPAPGRWPWVSFSKLASPRRNLVRAGALILAEIERLDRAALRSAEGACDDAR